MLTTSPLLSYKHDSTSHHPCLMSRYGIAFLPRYIHIVLL